jgi:hypothetical protein
MYLRLAESIVLALRVGGVCLNLEYGWEMSILELEHYFDTYSKDNVFLA